jgi:hypothetical protein
VDAEPVYRAAIATHRPALVKLYADTFGSHRLDALVFPTVPRVALPANADASSVPNFILFIQNTDPGSNAGIPGIQLPMGMGASTGLPIGLELDGPAGSDRACWRSAWRWRVCWDGCRRRAERVQPHAARRSAAVRRSACAAARRRSRRSDAAPTHAWA